MDAFKRGKRLGALCPVCKTILGAPPLNGNGGD